MLFNWGTNSGCHGESLGRNPIKCFLIIFTLIMVNEVSLIRHDVLLVEIVYICSDS